MDQQFGPRTQEAKKPDGDGLNPVPSVSRTLEKQGSSVLRCSFGLTPLLQRGSGDRFLPLRLGSCVESQGTQGDLESSAKAPAHKCALALGHFLTFLKGKHVLVRSDNTSTVYRVNHQGDTRSSQSLQEARSLLQWIWPRLASLWEMHLPGVQNKSTHMLSRLKPPLGEWRLNLVVVQMTWERYSKAKVDLFASKSSTHCPPWFSVSL